MQARKPHDKNRYQIANARCLGCGCFIPGIYTNRGLSGSGSKNSGESAACLTNAYRGCPTVMPFSDVVERRRKAQGWRVQ
jgi:hypothetical protein